MCIHVAADECQDFAAFPVGSDKASGPHGVQDYVSRHENGCFGGQASHIEITYYLPKTRLSRRLARIQTRQRWEEAQIVGFQHDIRDFEAKFRLQWRRGKTTQ
jgi:hypothetical protein